MQPAAHLGDETIGSCWRVSRDGNPVAVVEVRHEGGGVVVAAEEGMRSMWEDGIWKVAAGVTSVEELARVCTV